MTELFLFNSKNRKKEIFEPLDPKWIRIYSCGPTLHDNPHLGNARPAVVFDVFVRVLKHIYGDFSISYVRNLTDVDDKIIDKAKKLSTGDMSLNDRVKSVAVKYKKQYQRDMAYLNNLRPNVEPRATQHIPRMIEMIQTLLEKGHAYVSEGHVLFDVESYSNYGDLSKTHLKSSESKETWKRNSLDFVLWKPSLGDTPKWKSPWSDGRPGWHIECSAMSSKYFGNSFDIHCGGKDLLFPHHENELAQSVCCFNGTSARYYLHNEFVRIGGDKMSKSSGQFISLRELERQGIPGVVVRFALLSTHYRHPLDWTDKTLLESLTILNKWRPDLEGINDDPNVVDKEFMNCLKDDLNTPKAIARLHKLYISGDLQDLKTCLSFMGLRFHYSRKGDSEIKELLDLRESFKRKKDYRNADLVRESLNESGVSLMDGTDKRYEKNILFDFDTLKWSVQRHLSRKRTNLERWKN